MNEPNDRGAHEHDAMSAAEEVPSPAPEASVFASEPEVDDEAVEAADDAAVEAADNAAVEAADEAADEVAQVDEVEADAIEDAPAAASDVAPTAAVAAPALVEAPALVDEPVVDEELNDEIVVEEAAPAEPTPRILTVDPTHGPATRPTRITVTGEAFAEGCLVRVGSEDLHPTELSETSFQVDLPPRETGGYVDIRVVNPDQQNALSVNAFHYDPPPRVDRIEPDFCSPKGGASILVLGQDFVEGCLVLLGDVELPVFPKGKSKLEIVVPPRASGQFDIVVKNPDEQTGTLERALCFADPPVMTGIEPMEGVIAGGTRVAVTGRNFMPGTGIEVALEPVTDVTYESPTRLCFVTPAHTTVEAVDIAVVNPTGLRHRLPMAFSYRLPAPRVESVMPAFGPNAGGTRLTLTGQDFVEGCEARVCGIAVKVAFQSTGELWVTSPEVSRSGLCDIVVVNPDEQAFTLEKGYRYDAPLLPPVLTTVSPLLGSAAGGLKIAVIGENFTDQTVVRLGTVVAQVRFLTHKELEVITPAGSGEVAIEVINPDGVAVTLDAPFVYEALPAPTITSIQPVNGPSIGGTKVIIEGTNFNASCSVYVGREPPKDVVVKSATEIHIITAPRKAAGVVDVEVAAPAVPKAIMKNGFRYDAVPAPTISSISPNRGGVDGGTELSITGQNFLKETTVLVDGKPVAKVKFIDKSNLELKMPGGTDGKMVDVAVRNPDGKEAVQKRAFLYDARYG